MELFTNSIDSSDLGPGFKFGPTLILMSLGMMKLINSQIHDYLYQVSITNVEIVSVSSKSESNIGCPSVMRDVFLRLRLFVS